MQYLRCNVCGDSYRKNAAGRRSHDFHHDVAINGAIVRKRLQCATAAGRLDVNQAVVYEITRGATDTQFTLAENVASLANRQMAYDICIYSRFVPTDIAYLAVREGRVVGLAVVASCNHGCSSFTVDANLQTEASGARQQLPERPAIAFIWTVPGARRAGLARELIVFVAERQGLDVTDLAWWLPLTADGSALVRSLTGGPFYGTRG